MSLNKIPLLLSAALFYHITQTPPNQAPPPKRRMQVGIAERLFTKTFKLGLPSDKIIVWLVTLCECAAILAVDNTSSPNAKAVISALTVSGSPRNIRVTKPFLVGWVLVLWGGYIRISCYRALGRFFTFELAVHDKHKLVTTGPYAVVRHPSYTGSFFVKTGLLICHVYSASWMTQCGILETKTGKALTIGWVMWSVFLLGNLAMRTGMEDEVMKKEFGSQWIEWSKRVPYRLVPGIY